MQRFERRIARLLVFAALCLLVISVAASADAADSRYLLWGVVTSCLDPGVAGYCGKCRWPRVESSCATGMPCEETTEVWAQTEAFVALRDRKMCGCPQGFVHGLVVPRARVVGVEDPRRPDDIWVFAWAVALKKIGDQSSAALVVNPAGKRTQDQLHVHILLLKKDARARFAKALSGRVQKLAEVWFLAGNIAAAAGLSDYGILVAAHPEGGFLVVIDSASPEKSYGVERCL